jgi:hypothetical protein
MENYLVDRFRADHRILETLKSHLEPKVNKRRCIVMGSAPNPVVPPLENAFSICVNGSVFSAYKHWSTPPDLTYLNGAIFNDGDSYAKATLEVISGKNIGDVVIARHTYALALEMMGKAGMTFGKSFPVSKYDKRIILGEAIGHSIFGTYPFEANVSNGLFMASMALWLGAPEVVLVGFSFNSQHAYSTEKELSTRGHIREDALFLKHAVAAGLPFSTTSPEISKDFGMQLF